MPKKHPRRRQSWLLVRVPRGPQWHPAGQETRAVSAQLSPQDIALRAVRHHGTIWENRATVPPAACCCAANLRHRWPEVTELWSHYRTTNLPRIHHRRRPPVKKLDLARLEMAIPAWNPALVEVDISRLASERGWLPARAAGQLEPHRIPLLQSHVHVVQANVSPQVK